MRCKKLELSNLLFPSYHSNLLLKKKKHKQLHLQIREQKGVVHAAQMFLKSAPC